MTEYQIQSKNFLPDSIRDYDFYSRLTEIVDYILDKYHTQNIDVLKALYDIKNSNFDYEKILELLGSTEFIEYDVGSEQFKTLCVLLSNLYEIKGTKKGLQYLLRLLDIECEVYEWYDINKWYQQGDPRWTQPAEPCSIVLQLGLEHRPIGVCDRYDKWALPRTGSPAEAMLGENQAFEDTEGKFRDFATRLLWICTSLTEIRWAKILTDYVDVTSVLAWESTEVFYDKYSPFVYNCPNTIQVGFPFYQEFPYVGDNVKVGDFEYKQYSFLVRSFRDYNDPINYDGWTNTGIVGYSQTVASGDTPLVGDPDLRVGQIFYWNYEGVYTYPGWYYVGQILIEGNISVGCPIVSGCQVSIIHTHTETAFENDFLTHRGIIVGYEDFVQPPDNIGDGHIVDTQPGDILLAEEESTFVENPIPVEITDLTTHKETAYTSHISDLYEPFLVGDPTKFVGDTNLRVGQDYFFTWFEASKEIDFAEQFHTTCLQVGSWGHAYFPETTYSLVVGQPNINAGVSYFVGENTTPEHFEDKNPLLYVGTFLFVGSNNIVSPTIKVGQGFNYVGELAGWNATDFVTQPKNIIYEWLETEINPEIIEEEIPVFEQLETGLAEFELSSDIRASLWNKLVGASPVVGREEYFSVGTIYRVGYGFIGEYFVGETEEQQTIGFSPNVGYSEYVGSDFIAEDPYCKLTVDKEITLGGERFVYETPVVGDARISVGYTGFTPIYIGHSEYKYYSVGDLIIVGYSVAVGAGYEDITGTPLYVGDPITVGQQEFISTVDTYVGVSATGEIYNGTQINVASLFDTEHDFSLQEDIISKEDSFSESVEITGFTDKVFKERIGDIYASNTYFVSATDTVGEILTVSPTLFVGDSTDGIRVDGLTIIGQADYNVKEDQISKLTTEIESTFTNKFLLELPIVAENLRTVGFYGNIPILVDPTEIIGDITVGQQEFISNVDTYVNVSATGEIYDGTQNIINSSFNTVAEQTIQENIPLEDAVKEETTACLVDKVFEALIGDIYASNTALVSATDTVGESLIVDPSIFVGNSIDGIRVDGLTIIGQADYNVKEDQISKLTTEIESFDLQNQIYFNSPVVEMPDKNYILIGQEYLIGAGEINPVVAGDNIFVNEGELVGGFNIIPGESITVGISEYSHESVISKLFVGAGATVSSTSISAINSRLVCYIDEGDDISASYTGIVNTISEIDSNILSLREEQFNLNELAENSIQSTLSSFIENLSTEQFNVNEELTPLIVSSEENNILIFTPATDEINPVYMSYEQMEPYTFDPSFNPTNTIQTALTYLIDET